MNRTLAPLVVVALVLAAITALTGCGGDSEDEAVAKQPQEEGTVLRITDTSKPGSGTSIRIGSRRRPGR